MAPVALEYCSLLNKYILVLSNSYRISWPLNKRVVSAIKKCFPSREYASLLDTLGGVLSALPPHVNVDIIGFKPSGVKCSFQIIQREGPEQCLINYAALLSKGCSKFEFTINASKTTPKDMEMYFMIIFLNVTDDFQPNFSFTIKDQGGSMAACMVAKNEKPCEKESKNRSRLAKRVEDDSSNLSTTHPDSGMDSSDKDDEAYFSNDEVSEDGGR
jgi:hypothetical protein